MKDALKSLVLIVTGLLIASAFAWIYIYNRGAEQPLKRLAHPFFDAHPGTSLIAYGGGGREAPENTFLAFDRAAALGPDVVLWADVQVTRDGAMMVFRDKDVTRVTGATGWINFMTEAEVEKLDAGFGFENAAGEHPFRGGPKGPVARIPKLSEFLDRYPARRLVLNFAEYAPGLDDRIEALIKTHKDAGQRIVFLSDVDGLTKDLRERQAMWLYGTSRAQATRFLMLTSLGLAIAAKMRGDVYVTPPRVGKAPLLDESSLEELKRRKMPFLVGPVRDEAEARAFADAGADGVIADAPSEIRFLLPPARKP